MDTGVHMGIASASSFYASHSLGIFSLMPLTTTIVALLNWFLAGKSVDACKIWATISILSQSHYHIYLELPHLLSAVLHRRAYPTPHHMSLGRILIQKTHGSESFELSIICKFSLRRRQFLSSWSSCTNWSAVRDDRYNYCKWHESNLREFSPSITIHFDMSLRVFGGQSFWSTSLMALDGPMTRKSFSARRRQLGWKFWRWVCSYQSTYYQPYFD